MKTESIAPTTARGARRRIPWSVFKTATWLVVWLAVPWWAILGTPGRGEGAGMFAVALAFSVIAFGIAAIVVVRALHARGRATGTPLSLKTMLPERVQVDGGALPMRQAAMQVLLVPAAIAIGFTLLALVEVIERV